MPHNIRGLAGRARLDVYPSPLSVVVGLVRLPALAHMQRQRYR